jgi:1-acyl-sn-glycerol-3-phosphate acyltransferase
MRVVRDWLCTILFLIAFGALMVVFDVALRVGWLLGPRAQAYVGGALQVLLVVSLRICGVRYEIERSPLIRADTPYIVVSNHQSMFDIPAFGYELFSNFPKYIAKVELSRWIPAVSFHLRTGGNAIIDRKDRDTAVKAIATLGEEVVKHKCSAVIFPEGTRARKGELQPFKPAGTVALLTRAPDAPVVPVCIDNSWRILQHRMMPIPYGIRIRAWFGDPILRRENEDPYAIVADVERQVRSAMVRLRGGKPAQAA